MYQDINRPETIKGLKIWKNEKNKFNIIMLHYSADPSKDPDRQGKEWYDNERNGTPLASWNKEYEIDFTTKSGKLVYGKEFCDFDVNIHLINSFEFQEPVEQLIALDFGQRNPTCALVGAWNGNNQLFIVDEYYEPALPSVSSKRMMHKFAPYIFPGMDPGEINQMPLGEKRARIDNAFQIKVIDPTTQSKNRTKVVGGDEIEYSVIEEFYDHGWEFEPASNDVKAGINRVREYMQINPSTGKAHLYIFKDKCPHLVRELMKYRYKELTDEQAKTRNDSEEVIKKDDHGPDTLRYMVMTRPNKPAEKVLNKTRIQKDIENLIRPKVLPDHWDADN